MTLEDLEAEYEIRRVLGRYSHAVDRRDNELLRSCYHPDAHDEHMSYSGGVEGFIESLNQNPGRFSMRFHHMGPPRIEISGDVAAVETYCTSSHITTRDTDGLERVWILWLRYEDRFEKRNGEWRIADRVCRFEGDVTLPASATLIPPDKRQDLHNAAPS